MTLGMAAQTVISGELAYCLLDLEGGQHRSHHAAQPLPSASTYKLPMLLHCALAVAEGHTRWEQLFTLEDRHKSYGTGILKDLTTGLTLSLRDLCSLMTVLSDNTAANMLVEFFGLDALNRRLEQLGFSQTRLQAQSLPESGAWRAPLAAGVTTAREMAQLMRGIVQHTWTTPEMSRLLLELLGAQQDHTMIPRFLPAGWQYAGKTGSNPDLRADVGMVTSPGGRPFVLALFYQFPENFDWSVDSPGVLVLARLAEHLLLPYFSPKLGT